MRLEGLQMTREMLMAILIVMGRDMDQGSGTETGVCLKHVNEKVSR